MIRHIVFFSAKDKADVARIRYALAAPSRVTIDLEGSDGRRHVLRDAKRFGAEGELDRALDRHLERGDQLDPSQALFVDDQRHNVEAARALGLEAVHARPGDPAWVAEIDATLRAEAA